MTSGKLTIKLPSSDIPSTRISFSLEQYQRVPIQLHNSQSSIFVNPELPISDHPQLPAVHRASGEQSVSITSDDQKKYSNNSRRRRSLWNSGNSEALADIETRKKQQQEELLLQQKELAKLQSTLVETQRIETEQNAAQIASEIATMSLLGASNKHPLALSVPSPIPNRPSPKHQVPLEYNQVAVEAKKETVESSVVAMTKAPSVAESEDTVAPLNPVNSPTKSPSKFKSKDIRQQLLQKSILLLSRDENQEVAEVIDDSLHELHNSKSRDQLQTLKKFVMGHTRRKIVANWNMIENRFKTSPLFKIILARDKNGLEVPVKFNAVHGSALTSVLCSSRVKISHREIGEILIRLGISEEQVFLARQIAAHHVVIGICQEAKSDLAHVYTAEMQKLLRKETFLISIRELEDLVFSDDPEERKKELEAVHGNRNAEVHQMLEEKKKKDEKREQIAAGRKKLIDEFEKILGQVQLLRAPMNAARVELLQFIVQESRSVIHDYYEEQTSKVPMDVLSFLGIEAYPKTVQDKVRGRMDKLNAIKAAAAGSKGGNGIAREVLLSRGNSQHLISSAPSSDSLDTTSSHNTYLVGATYHATLPGISIEILEGLEDPTPASVTVVKLAGPAALFSEGSGKSELALQSQPSFNRSSSFDSDDRRFHIESTASASTDSPRATTPRTTTPRTPPPLKSHKSHKEQKLEVLMAKKKQQLLTPVATSSMGSIMSCMRGMVAIGKTFPGISYREAVEMLQYVAVTKIATAFRGFRKRWRFTSARRMWRAKFNVIASRHFRAWAKLIQDFVALRTYCWRKLKAWRYYTRYTKWRRESFRLAFWPLYTWRKYTAAARTAKEKTKFLVGRVMPTLTAMRHFRAWRDYVRQECQMMRLARSCTERKCRAKAVEMLRFLRFWARQRKRIRSGWIRVGQPMRTKNLMRIRYQTIRIWQSFAWIRKYARERIRSEFWWIKQTLLGGKSPLKKKSLADRRILASPKRHAGGETALMNQSMNKVKANMSKKSSLVGNSARKVVKPTIQDASGENDKILAKVMEECRRRKQRYFTWRPKETGMNNYFDIDSDGEDGDDVPPMLLQLYQMLQPKLHHFEQILEQPFNLSPIEAAEKRRQMRAVLKKKLKRQEKYIQQGRATLKPTSAASRSRANTPKGKLKPRPNKTKKDSMIPSRTNSMFPLPISNWEDDGSAESSEANDDDVDDDGGSALIFTHTSSIPLSSKPVEINFIATAHIESAQRGYELREVWNLYDAAWRFHRFGHLAFHNLRMYARVKHNVREFVAKRRERLLTECWSAWNEIVNVARRLNRVGSAMSGVGEEYDDGMGYLDSADVLVYRMRSQHTSKVSRTRKISEEVRQHSTRAEEDEEEARKRYIQRMKNLNLIADDDDEYLDRQRQQALQRIAENKARLANQWLHGYLPPNMLDLDRRDRLKELKLMKDMLGFGVRLKVETSQEVQTSDERHAEFLQYNATITNMVQEVLDTETAVTEQAVEKQLDYASRFKEHVADLLITTLANVREAVLTAILKAESKIYFRALRLPMLISRSYKMYNRKILRNYIRVCKRLIAINRLAPFYHKMRKKWVLFNLWLQYVEKAKLHPTAGFARMLRRRLLLHPDFHNTLTQRGFINKSYMEDERLRSVATEFKVIFSRWKMYAQENILFRMMHERVGKLARLKILRRFFWGLKHQLSVEDPDNYRQMVATVPTCFPMIQLQADLDQITKRFVPIRKRLLPQTIKTKNKKVIFKRKVESKDGLTFKKFLTSFSTEVSVRISTEQRLLFDAFEERGWQSFVHRCVPTSRTEDATGVVPVIMSKLEASSEFADPKEEMVIPAGFRLAKLKFAMVIVGNTVTNANSNAIGDDNDGTVAYNNNVSGSNSSFVITSSAIMGWQMLWTGEGCAEIESRQRGLWHSAGMTVQEIAVPKDDFVIGIEYMYDGAYMVALRCRFFHNNWSRWIGGKTSLSTLSVYISCDAGPVEDFEAERMLSEEEKKSLALPYSYVMGLTGLIYNQRATCLGLIVRKVQKQNLFSYHWVQDRLVQARLEDGTADSGALDQLPSVMGIHSLPSEIEVDNPVLAQKAIQQQQPQQQQQQRVQEQGEAIHSHRTEVDEQDEDERQRQRRRRSLGIGAEGGDPGGVVGTHERGGTDNDFIPMGESLTLSQVNYDEDTLASPNPYGRSQSNGLKANGKDLEDDESEDHDVFAEDSQTLDNNDDLNGSQNTSINGSQNPLAIPGSSRGRADFLRRRFLRQFQTFDEDGNMKDDVLSEAEQQFFDTIRMRMTEIAAVKQRVTDFARFLWSAPSLRGDKDLKKLLSLKIISGLSRWLFNALSRRLLPICATEKQGLQMMKQGRRMVTKGKGLTRQSGRYKEMAEGLEQMRMSWTGKSLLGPAERALKKEHMQKIAALYQEVRDLQQQSADLHERGQALIKQGERLLPRLALSLTVYNNFRHKVAAARHKETLLERMSLEDIKKGFFGNNMKETLLNRDQMQAIHASLRDRKIEMKDTSSLQRLLASVLEEEEEAVIAEVERKKRHEQLLRSSHSVQHRKQQRKATPQLSQVDEKSSVLMLSAPNSTLILGKEGSVQRKQQQMNVNNKQMALLSASMPALPPASLAAAGAAFETDSPASVSLRLQSPTEPSSLHQQSASPVASRFRPQMGEQKKQKQQPQSAAQSSKSGKPPIFFPPIPIAKHPSQQNKHPGQQSSKLNREESGRLSLATLDDSLASQPLQPTTIPEGKHRKSKLATSASASALK